MKKRLFEWRKVPQAPFSRDEQYSDKISITSSFMKDNVYVVIKAFAK